MTILEALDTIFYFIPQPILKKLKNDGFYSPIINGQAKDAAEFYDFLSDDQLDFQDADYSWLAKALSPILLPGAILQIGCGQGDLLSRLAIRGHGELIGLDRSQALLAKAKQKLISFPAVRLYCSRVEDFDFSRLSGIKNIIIQNFWGIIDEKTSKKLLIDLKKCLMPNGQLVIGEYRNEISSEKYILANKTLKEKLNFSFAYPFFLDFESCGYSFKQIELSGLKYFLLTQPNSTNP